MTSHQRDLPTDGEIAYALLRGVMLDDCDAVFVGQRVAQHFGTMGWLKGVIIAADSDDPRLVPWVTVRWHGQGEEFDHTFYPTSIISRKIMAIDVRE